MTPRQRARAAREALDRDDRMTAFELAFGKFDSVDLAALAELDRRLGQHDGDSAEDWRATTT